MLAIRHINARGGVLGRMLWQKEYDDQSPDDSVAIAKKIVKDGFKFVIGHPLSSDTRCPNMRWRLRTSTKTMVS